MPKFESSFLKKSNIFALEQTKKEYIRIVWFFGVLTGLALCLVVFFVVMQEMRQVNGDLLIWIFASIASVLFLITLFFGFKLFQVIQKQDVIYNKRKIRERVTAQKHFLEVETKKEKKMKKFEEDASKTDYSALGEEYAKKAKEVLHTEEVVEEEKKEIEEETTLEELKSETVEEVTTEEIKEETIEEAK